MMYERGKSDSAVGATKPANKAERSAAELVEQRAGTKGNADQQSTRRAQDRESVSQALGRIRQAAKQRKKEKFTTLFHHISVELLRLSFFEIKKDAAPGVDGLMWQDYEAGLDRNIEDLHDRVQRGAYRALPSRRQYIPKPDGRQRPIAIAALEDKIVQRATAAVLNTIYEEEFLGFSYGFRPKRNQHDALDALVVGITSTKVNWILEVDVRSFLDRVSYCTQIHEAWLKRSGREQLSLRRRPFLRPRLTWMASMSPRLTRCHTVCRETPSRRMVWYMVRYPSGASSATRLRKSSVRRMRQGAPGVSCSPAMMPSLSQR
jgi:retron-type reverse transcriptase